MATPNDIMRDELNLLEGNIDRLKVEYEQYFLGFAKVPPEKLRKQVDMMVRKYITVSTHNTGLKFRAQGLVQKMSSYRTLWDRILQQIEDGTYKRDIYKANLKEKSRQMASAKTPKQADELIEDAEIFEEEPEKPQAKWDSVFQQYISARTKTQEGVSGLTYDKLHDVLEKQAAQLKAKFQAKDVEFKVVIEDGKARLKATPKK